MIPEISGAQTAMVREWPFLLGMAQAREQENLLLPAPEKVAEPQFPALCSL